MTENDPAQDNIDVNKRSARLEALTGHLSDSLVPQKRIYGVVRRMLLWLGVSLLRLFWSGFLCVMTLGII